MDFLVPILPTIIVFVVAKRKWIKAVTAFAWFIGCIVSGVNILLYLIGTVIWYPIVALIAWLIRRSKKSK